MAWRQMRAMLLALAILLGLVEGCPLPPPVKTPIWERGLVDIVRAVQRVVLTPVAWLAPTLRIHQRWALYRAPGSERFRLWIEGADADGRWHVVFRAGDPDHAEFAERIDYTRPRGAWDAADAPPQQYHLFGDWMTEQVLIAHPEYIAARLRLEKVRLGIGGVTGTSEFVFEHINQRGRR